MRSRTTQRVGFLVSSAIGLCLRRKLSLIGFNGAVLLGPKHFVCHCWSQSWQSNHLISFSSPLDSTWTVWRNMLNLIKVCRRATHNVRCWFFWTLRCKTISKLSRHLSKTNNVSLLRFKTNHLTSLGTWTILRDTFRAYTFKISPCFQKNTVICPHVRETSILRRTSKGRNKKKNLAHTHAPRYRQRAHMLLAAGQPNPLHLLFTGSSPHKPAPQASCGPETADKHTSFFIWPRRWLQMPQDMELNHKHTLIWRNLSSSIQSKHMFLQHLCSSSLPGGRWRGLGGLLDDESSAKPQRLEEIWLNVTE